jgi:ubiquinone/menaquinone biosynthesis C-methylase UbiE
MKRETIKAPQDWNTSAQVARYWDNISRQIEGNYYHDTLVGHFKRDVHLKLIRRWHNDLENKVILKTDLFEEAHGPDQFLFEIKTVKSVLIGIDISPVITAKAKRQAAKYGRESYRFVTCDVRALPFADNSLDMIVSNSTLDHFPQRRSLVHALSELHRVLKPSGTLIVTLDNKHSISYLISRIKDIVHRNPFYIGETCSMRALTRMLQEVGFFVSETTTIIHGLENHGAHVMAFIKKFNSPLLNKGISKLLVYLERLERTKTRHLTGAFIAAKAVKAPP